MIKVFIEDVTLSTHDLCRIVEALGPDAHVGAPHAPSPGFGFVAHVMGAVEGPDPPAIDLELVKISKLADKGYRAVHAIPFLIAALRERPVRETVSEEVLWTT